MARISQDQGKLSQAKPSHLQVIEAGVETDRRTWRSEHRAALGQCPSDEQGGIIAVISRESIDTFNSAQERDDKQVIITPTRKESC